MARSANRIGILGGTFDPVHNGHLALARAARDQLGLDQVYMLLSPLSPFKVDKNLTPLPDRLAMLTLAIEGEEKISVGDWELKRRGPSTTVVTLAQYMKKNPAHELFLILGSDALERFHEWKNPEKILKMVTLVIGRRPGRPLKVANLEGRMFFLSGVFPETSSSAIRYGVSLGRTPKDVPLPVAHYIKARHLYEKQ